MFYNVSSILPLMLTALENKYIKLQTTFNVFKCLFLTEYDVLPVKKCF